MTSTNAAAAEKPVIDLGLKNTAPRKLQSNNLKLAEYNRADFRVIIDDETTTRADVLRPEFWANVAATLKGDGRHPFAMIEVIWADASRHMSLMVVAVDRLWAKVVVVHEKEFFSSHEEAQEDFDNFAKAVDKAENNDFLIKHVSPTLKWCVIRKTDGERIMEKLAGKIEAQAWLDQHLKTIA